MFVFPVFHHRKIGLYIIITQFIWKQGIMWNIMETPINRDNSTKQPMKYILKACILLMTKVLDGERNKNYSLMTKCVNAVFSFHHSLRTHKLSVFSISLLKCGEEPRNYRPAGHTSIVRWTGDNQLFHLSTLLLGTTRMDYTVFLSVFYPSCIIADSFIFPPWSLILHCIINSLFSFFLSWGSVFFINIFLNFLFPHF